MNELLIKDTDTSLNNYITNGSIGSASSLSDDEIEVILEQWDRDQMLDVYEYIININDNKFDDAFSMKGYNAGNQQIIQ